jgi:hypothetical protein
LPLQTLISRAGEWFLRSGIQEPGGGVARYYRADLQRNHPVSTEITGYTVSALLSLQQDQYMRPALEAARFLCREAWDGHTLPFETGSSQEPRFTYFFDCGIVVRGLLSAWRATADPEFLQVAQSLGDAMAGFASPESEHHPILSLPEKRPLPYDPLRWSRAPGCYQLKSAMAWWDLFQATADVRFRESYDSALENALRHYGSFLPGHPDRIKVVDRLHAFLYFLEGLLPRAQEKPCAAALCHGIGLVSQLLCDTASEFERSDVYAQLLRIRLYAHCAGVAPLDTEAAAREAALLAEFQITSSDPRTDGGFYFGRQDGSWLPFVNPVSTAFAVQALALWDHYRNCRRPADPRLLI